MNGFDLSTDYQLLDFDEKPKQPAPETKACPKCGRAVGKGGHFHIKACKGVSDGNEPH